MAEKKKQPALRFKGFDGEWENRNLLSNFNRIIDFRGRTPKKLGLDWSESGYLALSALNVKNGYIDLNVDAHYGNQELYDKWMSGNELHKNQVLFTTEAPMGNVAQIPDDKRYILSQRTIAFEVKAGLIAEDFLAVLLSSPPVFHKLSTLTSGGTAKGISQRSLASVDLFVSKDIAEQTKIGALFKHLDGLIAHHQSKYDKLAQVKKAMLQKMFPQKGKLVPEIRFKGFSGEWEEKNWKETVDMSTNMVDPKTGRFDELFHIGPGNIESFTGRLYDNVLRVKDSNLISGKFHFNDGDIIYGKINPQLAKYAVAPYEGLASADAYVLNSKNGVVQSYLFIILQSREFYDYSVSVSARTGMPKINRDELNVFNFLAPSPTEQDRIGSYFKTLDKALDLHKQELEKLQHIKKACLEKMFV